MYHSFDVLYLMELVQVCDQTRATLLAPRTKDASIRHSNDTSTKAAIYQFIQTNLQDMAIRHGGDL